MCRNDWESTNGASKTINDCRVYPGADDWRRLTEGSNICLPLVVCYCDAVQHDTAYGFVNHNKVFEVSLPSNLTQGFVAYGTTSYRYADFDNLHIEDNLAELTTNIDSSCAFSSAGCNVL